MLQSVQTGRIQLSEDSALLLENPVRRGKKTDSLLPIYPKNEATLENRPTFRWQKLENSEYRITVLNRELNEVAASKILKQNDWRLNKELPAGFYFWQVSVRKNDAEEFVPAGNRAFFKIVGEAEKQRIGQAKKSADLNLVNAVLDARAGLFAEAEQALNNELLKHPKSAKARKMLAQVRRWQK